MDIKKIKERVRNIESKPLGVKKEYSVLIPLIEVDGELHILYELRSKDLRKQPREISFPGGAVEDDESFEQGAIRETMEELLIPSKNIEIIKEMDFLIAPWGGRINAFLGFIKGIKPDEINPSKDEVDHIFTVPLEWLLNTKPESYKVEFSRKMEADFPYNLIPNGEKYDWKNGSDEILFYNYKDYNIWGFTAKMTKNFIDIIKNPIS